MRKSLIVLFVKLRNEYVHLNSNIKLMYR